MRNLSPRLKGARVQNYGRDINEERVKEGCKIS
jgi:hypothetical protein